MFIQVYQGRVSDPGEMRAALDRWSRELAPGATGWLGSTSGVTEDGTFIGVVRFDSQEAARRNSDRHEQHQWWVETAKLFGGEVIFHDCVRAEEVLGGGSDSAGFVQVIQGRIRDMGRMRELMRRSERELGDFRPDVIGGTHAEHGDGGFTDTIYFTSEQEAREGERKQPTSEVQALLDEEANLYEGDLTYHDLKEPWFHSPAGRGRA
jgi:hypothetical protein